MSRSVAPQFERALRESAERAGCPIAISASSATRWASATFVGERHMLTITGTANPGFDLWIDGLPEAEWALCGHLVADLAVMARHRLDDQRTVELEALTVEDS
jgi:hypothetical protein